MYQNCPALTLGCTCCSAFWWWTRAGCGNPSPRTGIPGSSREYSQSKKCVSAHVYKNNTQMRARVAKYTLKENSCSVSWGVAWSRSLCRNSLMLSTATPKGRRYSWGNLCLAESESSIRPTRITCATTTMSRFRSELPRSCVTHNPTNHPAILLKIARRFLCGHTRGYKFHCFETNFIFLNSILYLLNTI